MQLISISMILSRSKKPVILFVFTVATSLILSCGRSNEEVRTRLLFDTVVVVTIEAEKGYDIAPVCRAVWEELSAWDIALDAWDSTGHLFEANRAGSLVVLDEKLANAVAAGIEHIETTGGDFDIRVGQLTILWDFSGGGNVPLDSAIAIALRSVRAPIDLRADTLVKPNIEAMLDLGGLGKGIAAAAVAAILDTIPQITRYIIDLGGNIAANDKSGDDFTIGIRHPREPNAVIATFRLPPGRGCATAGDYQRYFERNGVRYHHILNPSTGFPARNVSAVTVLAPDALTADILSTAFFVKGYNESMVFLADNPQIRAAFFDTKGEYLGGTLEIELLDAE